MLEKCIGLLKERGVTIDDIVQCVNYLQKDHDDNSYEETCDAVINVLKKREVQHAIITGIAIDKLAEKNALQDDELQHILNSDYSLYGVDEVLAYGICNLYGSIALTNFGYIDKDKPLIIKQLNENRDGTCNTFLDDIIGAIAASAASRMAHSNHKGD